MNDPSELEALPPGVPNVRQVEVFKGRIGHGHVGYLSIDNRLSGGELKEYDTLVCCHCSAIVALNPKRVRAREFCLKCNDYVCDTKGCVENCYSMERSAELVLANPEIPGLPRNHDGSLLFDPALLEKGKPF